jgi:hypothetical protein
MKKLFGNCLMAGFMLAAACFTTAAFAQKDVLSTPVLSCGTATNGGWIDVKVCAGATGMPAGFSLQWMKYDDFVNGTVNNAPGTWPSGAGMCGASFSGNASGSRYNLLAGECVTVKVGDLLLDNGASTDCDTVLDCGTSYVFRAFAHATSKLKRSAFTSELVCSTAECSGCYGALSQGGFRNNFSCYVTDYQLGNVPYTAAELVTILNTTGQQNNNLTKLAKQLIAVEMSRQLFDDACVDDALLACVAEAHALIGDNVVLVNNVDTTAAANLIACLDNWIGNHHMPDELEPTPCP